jgi:hypothetical protein
MELSTDQEDELRSVLAQHPIGISTEALWAKCKTFGEKQELSLGLHAAKHQGWMYNKSGLHFLVTTSKDYADTIQPTPTSSKEDPWAASKAKFEPKSLRETFPETSFKVVPGKHDEVPADSGPNTKVALVVESPTDVLKEIATMSTQQVQASTQVVQGDKRLPFGDLHRSKSLGAAALALFKFRAEPALTLDDMVAITQCPKTSLYSVMTKLVEQGYADKNDTDFRKPYFKWSNKFAYPFDKTLATDTELLPYPTVAAYYDSKRPKVEIEPVVHKDFTAADDAMIAADPKWQQTTLSSLGPIGEASGCCVAGHATLERPVLKSPGVTMFENSEYFPPSSIAGNKITLAVQQLDFEIAHYKHQVEMLTKLRDVLVA